MNAPFTKEGRAAMLANEKFVRALRREAGLDRAPKPFRCGHPNEGGNLQFMGGRAVCRKCRTESRNAHRAKYRAYYVAEAIERARTKLFQLYSEAERLDRPDLLPDGWGDDWSC